MGKNGFGNVAKAVLAGAAVATSVAIATPASAATTTTTTIGGVKVDTTVYDPGLDGTTGTRITFTLLTARTLDVRCNSAGKVSMNGTALPTTCAAVRIGIGVVGSAGNDTVTVDGKGLGVAARDGNYRLDLGYGHDKGTVLHGDGVATLLGGGGNDTLAAGLYGDQWRSPEFARSVLDGGAGDDTLTNRGYITPNTQVDASQLREEAATMIGGAGADRIWGSNVRAEDVVADLADSVTLSSGPGSFTLATSTGTDTVTIKANGNYGPLLKVVTGSTTKDYALPTLLDALTVQTGAGNDAITVEHKSVRTRISVVPGAGTDAVTIRPRNPFTWNATTGVVSQPGHKDIAYERASTEKVTVKAL